jgi:carbon-monoxide dehydrogenase catalytic subunit
MPPVLHMGSCVDCSRILEAATAIVAEGGLGEDISDVPAVGVAPEWMSEKAVAIASYFVASGVDVVLGHPFHVSGSENVTSFLNDGIREMFGAAFHDAAEPAQAAKTIMELINARRENLGINRKSERQLWDMADRRKMDV